MKSLFMFLSLSLIASNSQAAPKSYDYLKCQTNNKVIQFSGYNNNDIFVEKVTISNDFIIYQNENRNYATIFVDGEGYSGVNYKRTIKGTEIYTSSWASDVDISLKPIKTSNIIHPSVPKGSVAFEKYVGMIKTDQGEADIECSFQQI